MIITSKKAGLLPVIVFGFCILNAVSCDEDDADIRNKKQFSLFSVVTFPNSECSSEASFNGGQIQGTCYSATECTDKSGTKSGNCASGFGVCCTFVYSLLTSTTISENRTYVQNPLYPNVETSGAGTTTSYTINKMKSDICQIRLDFDYFVIAGPANTGENGVALNDANGNCIDTWKVTLSGGAMIPALCGVLTNMHLYMDMGMDAADTAKIDLALGSTTLSASISGIAVADAYRKFRVKIQQISCWDPNRAPEGCNLYYTSLVGQIYSPNFSKDPAGSSRGANQLNSGVDLLSQQLKYCIRREVNHCCVLFQVCNQFEGIDLTNVIGGGNVANGNAGNISEGWSFHVYISGAGEDAKILANNDTGLVDSSCTGDYVEIPDSHTGYKSYGYAAPANTRYCAHRFGNIPAITIVAGYNMHAPVWDCTEPFEVIYHTDQMNDNGVQAGIVASADQIRGLCLDYRQDAC